MLPDLPELKAQIRELYVRYVAQRAHLQIGLFREVPRHVVHEGESMRMARSGGDVEDSSMMQTSAEVIIPDEKIALLCQEERLQILNDLADRMAADMAKKLYAALSESLDRAGQTVDNRGRPLDAEAVLRAFEKMEFEFDRNGNPKLPSISVGSDMQDALKRAEDQLSNDPVWSARFAQLMATKKANWRDREANRKLVG